jgi:hypothetical protein
MQNQLKPLVFKSIQLSNNTEPNETKKVEEPSLPTLNSTDYSNTSLMLFQSKTYRPLKPMNWTSSTQKHELNHLKSSTSHSSIFSINYKPLKFMNLEETI